MSIMSILRNIGIGVREIKIIYFLRESVVTQMKQWVINLVYCGRFLFDENIL